MFVRIFFLICLTFVSTQYAIARAAEDMWYVSEFQPSLVGNGIHLIDSENTEVSYVLLGQVVSTTTTPVETFPVKVVEQTDTAVVFDIGREGQVYTGLQLEVSPESKNFRKVVRVFIADTVLSARSPVWRELEKKNVVYAYADEDGFVLRNLNINFPDASTRYIKIQFDENGSDSSPITVTGAGVVHDTVKIVSEKKIRDYVAGNFDFTSKSPVKKVSIENNVFTDAKKITGVILRVDASVSTFKKTIIIETSDDGAVWKTHATGDVYRIDSPMYVGENTTLTFPPITSPYVRISTDLPIGNSVDVTTQEMVILFKIDPEQKNALQVIVDHTGIATSSYILQKELSGAGNVVPEIVAVKTSNTTQERNPYVVYGVILLIAGILAYLRFKKTRTA